MGLVESGWWLAIGDTSSSEKRAMVGNFFCDVWLDADWRLVAEVEHFQDTLIGHRVGR